MDIPKKVERRGGARPGSGPKPKTLSQTQIAKMLSKAKKWAKAHGKGIDDILLGFIYSEAERTADRIACIKLWKDITVPKIAEGGQADRNLGPSVYLPEHRPVLTAIDGGKSG